MTCATRCNLIASPATLLARLCCHHSWFSARPAAGSSTAYDPSSPQSSRLLGRRYANLPPTREFSPPHAQRSTSFPKLLTPCPPQQPPGSPTSISLSPHPIQPANRSLLSLPLPPHRPTMSPSALVSAGLPPAVAAAAAAGAGACLASPSLSLRPSSSQMGLMRPVASPAVPLRLLSKSSQPLWSPQTDLSLSEAATRLQVRAISTSGGGSGSGSKTGAKVGPTSALADDLASAPTSSTSSDAAEAAGPTVPAQNGAATAAAAAATAVLEPKQQQPHSAPAPAAASSSIAVDPRWEELRRRWAHLPEPEGPSPFPEFTIQPDLHMWTSPVWASATDVRRSVFCNRSLNMKSVAAVGFDMDYTLAQYRAETFEALAYNSAIAKLVNQFGYPEELLEWKFDWRYMVRGLVLDKKRGNILKMDRHKYVKKAYHGFRELSREERKVTYNSTRARESFDEPDYALIDTLFSLGEAYLFAQLVDFCDAFPEKCPPNVVAPGTTTVNYWAMYKNVRSAVDLCHRDGTLKSAVAEDPRKYLSKDEQVIPMLKMLRESGRKIFLVTNSLWDYTHVVMNCLVGNCGSTPDTQRNYDWLQLFDVVITGSGKPSFFLDNNRAGMFEVDVATGMLFNTDDGSPTAQVGDLPSPPPTLRRGEQACQVYQGGSVAHLHRMLKIDSGSQVLYVGDHIYGDILRSKKTLGWRTMLVVPELVREVHVLGKTRHLQQEFHRLRHEIDGLDDAIQRIAWALRFESMQAERLRQLELEIMSLKAQKEAAKAKYKSVMKEWHSAFHPVWGMLMKTGYQNSRFAHQVERFACLYTSHVTNMAYYSPDKNFRTVEDYMPHEQDLFDI